MPVPNLLHPVDCTISRIDRAGTLYDTEAREPVQAAKRAVSVVVPGQAKWFSENELNVQAAGPDKVSRGYVLFRKVDLDARGFMIAVDDRITGQGFLIDEVYIIRIEPIAHYPDQGGATMFKAHFSDRNPAKTRR